MNDIDETLNRLIADAEPLSGASDPGLVDRAWAAVEAELRDHPMAPLRRPNRWRQSGVVGAVAAVALAASAAAVFVATRTGVQNPPEWVSAGGPGEEYRLDGTDFAAELAELGVDVPYPSEAARRGSLKAIADDAARSSGQASTGALRAEIARGAICTWTMAWQHAGNAAERETVVTALRGALTWPAVTDVDPEPAIDGDPSDTGSGPTVFGHLPGIIKAAADNDAEGLAAVVDESAYCAILTRPSATPAIPAPGRESTSTPAATTRP